MLEIHFGFRFSTLNCSVDLRTFAGGSIWASVGPFQGCIEIHCAKFWRLDMFSSWWAALNRINRNYRKETKKTMSQRWFFAGWGVLYPFCLKAREYKKDEHFSNVQFVKRSLLSYHFLEYLPYSQHQWERRHGWIGLCFHKLEYVGKSQMFVILVEVIDA